MKALGHIVLLVPVLIACGSRTDPAQEQHTAGQMMDSSFAGSMTSLSGASRADTTTQPDRGREQLIFQQSLPFRVMQLVRNNNANSSSQDTMECVGWSLTAGSCTKVLEGFAPISGHDWGELFDVLPCQVEGELEQAGVRFKFAVNAGSWIGVQCGDSTLYFGDMDKKFKKQFISTVWSGE